jgi:hypothetical protein
MGRILTIGVMGLLAAVGAAPASASARVTCHSGKTVFKRPGVRVIRVPRVYAIFKTKSSSEAPVLASIAINATTVSWQSSSGLAVSVPR